MWWFGGWVVVVLKSEAVSKAGLACAIGQGSGNGYGGVYR